MMLIPCKQLNHVVQGEGGSDLRHEVTEILTSLTR